MVVVNGSSPEDTPYSCGCFQFDIFFPSGYPKIPPLVNLQVWLTILSTYDYVVFC